MNKIILMGRLTKDPEVRYTQSGKVVCQFTIAVDRPFSGEDGKKEADFIPIIIWGKPAEIAGNSLAKGHRVLVEGLEWSAKSEQDGVKIFADTKVIIQKIEGVSAIVIAKCDD